MSNSNFHLEKAIIDQISELGEKISDLMEEKKALQRLLLKSRQVTVGSSNSVRKNSINRILVENTIIEHLKYRTDRTSNKSLFNITKIIVGNLKETTFRSYLKRMKDARLIENDGKGWLLVKERRETSG